VSRKAIYLQRLWEISRQLACLLLFKKDGRELALPTLPIIMHS